ncbi:MAG: dienelactone hydrolase family protein [Chitinophagaceae bacterium]
MKFLNVKSLMTAAFVLSLAACNNAEQKPADATTTAEPKWKEENVMYTGDSITMDGYVVYDENKQGARPAVLVVPEWWGLNDYTKRRARELAGLGYIAMAVDLYGNGKQADNPDSAGKYSTPFYQNPQMAKARFDAALAKLKTYSQTDASKIGAIGYCFGGAQVISMAKLGDDLKGVVSFHGNLTVVPANKDLLKAEILVCHGADDKFVSSAEVDQFKHQMDSIGAKYTVKVYPGATHAFTNPDATALGKKFNIPIAYNAAADTASWNEMKGFFGRIFQ